MKKLSLLILLSLIFVACHKQPSHSNYIKQPKNIQNFFQYKEAWKPMISIHRGGGDYVGFPENCLESFDYLAAKMPSIIECDIELTKDSVLMMMHDNSLERTTTGKGKIIDKNWSEINKLQLKDNLGNLTNFKIPTLEKILLWGKDKVLLTLDVKRNTPYKKVVEMVHKTHAENYVVIITYDANQAKEVYTLDPNLMISVTIRTKEEYDRHHALGIPDNKMVAFIGTREPNTAFTDFLHQKGICTILGTLGNLDKKAKAEGDAYYKNLVNKGSDILSTDRALEAFKAIN